MYFKFITLCLTLFSFSQILHAENKPEIEFIRYSAESLAKHPCKNFVALTEDLGKHPMNILHLKNFPRDKEITFFLKRSLIKKDYDELYVFSVMSLPEDSIFLPSAHMLPGEKVELYFRSLDGEFSYKRRFIPNPIRVKKGDKIVLTAELTMTSPTMDSYKINLIDIPEKEKLLIKSISENEIIEYPMVYSKRTPIHITPGVNWKKGGVSQVIFTRESGEKITINLPWGTELHKYAKGEDVFDSED